MAVTNLIDLSMDTSSESAGSPVDSQFGSRLPSASVRTPSLQPFGLEARTSWSDSRNGHRQHQQSLHLHQSLGRDRISPPPLKKSPVSATFVPSSNGSIPVSRLVQEVNKPQAIFSSPTGPPRDARDMSRPSALGSLGGSSQQMTPPLESRLPKTGSSVKATSPKLQTPRKSDWDVPRIVKSLTTFRQDIKDGHAQLATFIIDSTDTTERRVRNGEDLFAGVGSNKTEADPERPTMRVKFKRAQQHFKAKKDRREERHPVVSIQTDQERVPPYRFHHVEIKKNVLTPNTMLTFVPHLRDLESSEESKYNHWLQELEDIDRKSGFKPMNREQKVALIARSEFAATVSLYLDNWLERLNISGCNKSTLIRYMASKEPDDAITPRQKTDILNSQPETDLTASSEARRAAEMFTKAFDKVFFEGQPPTKQIQLKDVLLLDESVDSVMESKQTAKDGLGSQNETEEEYAEAHLASYCILGCMVCYSHSCEHGEYDAGNCKKALSIMPRLSDTLKRRRNAPLPTAGLVNGDTTPSAAPCQRQCHLISRWSPATSDQPWSEDEHRVLRSIVVTANHSKVKKNPICMVADILDRDCCEVSYEYGQLGISLPSAEPRHTPAPSHIQWYDRYKKSLIGDWQDHILSHEHQRRDLCEPCNHEGSCTQAKCECVRRGLLCEKFCSCSAEDCAYKFTGCACHSQGKTCFSKQKDRPCICVQLNRECDPDLCGSCGVLERADPINTEDEALHSTGCQNCSLQRGAAKTLVLGRSQLEGVGYGLYTAEDIAQDDFVVEYVGELITHDEGVRREARRGDVFDEKSNISYVFTLLENEGIWVDAAIYGNLSRYINHASESDKRGCNITPRILYVNGEYRIKFTAMRDIKAGEELFFNYGENFPNLTKKLLDHKAEGQPTQVKKKRRPRASEGDGVARKAPKAEKKKPTKTNGSQHVNFAKVDENVVDMADLGSFEPPKPSRKRKRDSRDESDEEEYHPTATDATGSYDESPSTLDSDESPRKKSARLRKRARNAQNGAADAQADKARAQPKTRGKRGGARPGSGRPRKYPRGQTKPTPTSTPKATATTPVPKPSTDSPVPPAVDTGAQEPTVLATFEPKVGATVIQDSEDDPSCPLSFSIDEDDEDDDEAMLQEQLDRGMRNRRLPAKFREGEPSPTGSQ